MRRKRRRDVDEHDKSAAERHDGDDDTDRCGVVASSSQHAADTAPPPPQVATVTSTTCSFGQYVWSDIGIIWYARLALLVHDACARCARAARRRHAQQQQQQQDDDSDTDNSDDDDSDAAAVLTGLACDMHVAWQAARVHFADAAERHGHDARVSAYTTRLLAALRDVAATHTDNDDSADADELTLCRRLLRVLEQHGLAEADCVGGMCSSSTTTRWRRSYSSALLRRLHELRQRRASRVGYAYSERTSMILTPPCGLDVGRRDDDNNNNNSNNSKSNSKSAGAATAATVTQPPSSRPRAGYVVQLPLPHPHREVNTAVQLLEPRRRRTALDEYRVVAHPKKAAAFAADDCIIEEELLHRAYVVLCHHLDVYGSLRDVSPYTRVTLWRLLDQDTATLLRLCLADATTATTATAVTAAVNGKDAAMRTRAAKREVVVAADSNNNNNNSNGHEEGNNKQDVGDDTNSSDNTGKTTAVAVTCGDGDDDDMHVADAALRLCRLRSLLQRKLAALEAARPACRRTAQCIAWAAASAQWRDAALAAMDAHDWYALRDTLRLSTTTSRYTLSTSSGGNSGRDGGGGNIVAVIVNNNNNSNSSSSSSGSSSGGGGVAIFPNYARAPAVRALALALLRKLDEHYDTATTTSVTPQQQQSGDGARRRSRSSTAASLSASREGSAATTSTSTTATTAAARRRRRQTRTAAAAASSSSSSATEARPGSVHEMVLRVLLPLLMGEVPTLTTSCVALHADELSTAAHTSMTTTTATEEDSSSNNNNTTQQAPPPSSSWRRQQARLHAFFDGRHVSVQRYARHLARTTTTAAAVTSDKDDNDDDDSDDDDGGGGCVYSFVCPSVVLALQSVAELLELCSLAHYSAIGMTAFARRLRSASWHDERTLLTFVSRREPANVALATMAGGVLRVYAELSAAVRQLATRERLLAAVVLARRLAAHSSLVDVRRRDRCYVYGTALASVFADDGRSDELYMLRVQCSRPPSQQQQQQRQRRRQRRRPRRSARGNGSGKDDDDDSDDSDDDTDDDDEEEDERERWCNEAALERAPAVWPEELRELMDDEARYRATHTSHDVSSS